MNRSTARTISSGSPGTTGWAEKHMHQLTNRIKTANLPRRLLFALRGATSLHLTNVLVLLLCYSIVLQPNAALAAQSRPMLALATVNGSETKQGTPAEVKGSTTPGVLGWLG